MQCALLSVQTILLAKSDRIFQGLAGEPRAVASQPRLTTYHGWFNASKWDSRPGYTYLAKAIGDFLRFKLSSHDLGIELGRWKHRISRCMRTCGLCEQDALDDERHMVFVCPTIQPVRELYPHFFWRSP